MDHFPPLSHRYNPINVPFLGGEYDGGDFNGYPSRQRWDLAKIQAGDLQNKSSAEAGKFLQSWLFFGMMNQVLGLPVPTTDFVRDSVSKKRFVTTHKLREYLRRWKSQVDQERQSGAVDVLKTRNKRAVACLNHAHNFWFNIDQRDRDRLVGPEVGLSIHILASTLEHALTCVCDIPVEDVPWRLERSDFLTQRMIDYGWCPRVVEQVCTTNHTAFQCYASMLSASSDPRRHDQCKAGDPGCSAKQVDDAKYETKHHLPHCGCDFFKAELDVLRDIVQGGSIPLVYLARKGTETALKVVPFRPGMHYTALSHV